MAEIIICKGCAYNIYSTISDSPIFDGALSKEELTEEIKHHLGNSGLERLPERLDRAERKGTSAIYDESLRDTIICNRAGDNEERLPEDTFVSRYLTRR